MKMWETECSSCGKLTPANQCPQLMMVPLCKPCWLMKNNMKITPETFQEMNEEFIQDGTPFRIADTTQEKLDEWQSQPSPPYQTPEPVDMVADMWKKHREQPEAGPEADRLAAMDLIARATGLLDGKATYYFCCDKKTQHRKIVITYT